MNFFWEFKSKFFFQFVFCAVSLAIVWGTTVERIKFGVYVIYAIIFSAIIYPLFSGWVFGGGWLQANLGMQDFAGSTAVHLIGATGGLAVLLLLGPRRGKYSADGKPRAIPGHNMPLFGLSVGILLIGWFGFNPGSTLNALDTRFAEVALVTLLAACAGVLGAVATTYIITKNIDIGMAGNGMIGALVAITAPSGYVVPWAGVVIGLIAGIIVPLVNQPAFYPHGLIATTNDQVEVSGWPNGRDVLHQQMQISSIRRAYEGGLRIMLASATDSQALGHLLGGPQFAEHEVGVLAYLAHQAALFLNNRM